MEKLTPEQFSKARNFLLTNARPVDRAMFQFEFEQGLPDEVLTELRNFQNEDGGFGHALEPDFRFPFSSAIATTIALQYVSRLQLDEVPAMVVRALEYLHATFDSEHQLWEPVPETVTQFPRAVWWEYGGPEKAEEYWANPAAEILGYFYEYLNSTLSDWRGLLLTKAFEKLENRSEPLEMHDLLCYLRLAYRLPPDRQTELYAKLDSNVHQVVAASPDEWRKYGVQPIQVAPSPESHYYPVLKPYVDKNLDFLVQTQGDDGAWNPTWQWWRYEDEWSQAKEEWRGVLTLDNLRVLRKYGRLDV